MSAARDIASLVLPDLPVALARRADPALRGRPVAVARGATVVAASAEAREAGVGPGTPAGRARRHAAVTPLDPEAVARARREVGSALYRYTPQVENAGGGAWYLDLSGTRRYFRRPPVDLLSDAAGAVAEDLRLPVQAALSSGKAVARMAAALGTERVTRILPGGEPRFVSGFPVSVLPGLGPVQRERLERLGLRRLGDVAAVPLPRLEAAFGPGGRLWGQWSRGLDPRPVAEPGAGGDAEEWRLSLPLSPQEQSVAAAGPALLGASERLGRRLRDRAERAAQVQVGLVHRDGVERARSARLEPTDRDFELFEAASALLQAAWERRVAARRVTVAVVERTGGGQGELFPADDRMDRLLRGIDAVRDRFGAYAVQWGRRLDGGA
ncbi:hypothetical protein AN478_05245 [Thiohalorhabdus denitrificans]|uniref:DNA polymerase-4 n=1 Tax=Thiohalorhabdus denitrificans TaxID=381306 RepID=A0A0P9CCH1_9GAMM|nr:hypothetical protein [Thiohalorhabdus denitrificans]KPV40585.1 hypothetical protein AN478_05245 [Thiohalorhabdus denitrificans]SCY50435.1 DNA polymerase-4 [Thiohalorhabdus denitrificans]